MCFVKGITTSTTSLSLHVREGISTYEHGWYDLAIEPMVNVGGEDVRVVKDGWTVVTSDGSLSCHYENTIAITEGDPIILTDVNVG